jgi:histidyl-tRNA synthetase
MTPPEHKAKFQAIKGVRDILPPESTLWNHVEQTAREVFGTFSFTEIRPPVFEQTELFARSIGGETDVVSKEMYTFLSQPGENFEKIQREIESGITDANQFGDEELLVAPIRNLIDELDRAMRARELDRTPAIQARFDRLQTEFVSYCGALARFRGQDSADQVLLARLRVLLHGLNFPVGESLSLRPEATASVVRAYIEHGMQVQPGNVKLYYMGPMFRRERPQKGRYRQFYQIGAEVLGTSDAPGIDAEVIEMLMTLFERLKLKGAVLSINSIGDKNCRPAYVEKLRAELQKVREELGPDSQRRIETNPLRVLDSKLASEQAIIEKLPRIGENLCDACRAHYAEVKRQLDLRGIPYQENWRLVRGLDYYMRTTFEITAPGLGSQNAVCGGGRYDGLVELLGGPAGTKGIGFAIGTDRLILSLQEAGEGAVGEGPAGKAGGPDVYLAWFGAASQTAAIGLAKRLRAAGFVVELPAVEMKFGKSLGLADRLKARHAVIIGDDELAAGVVTVKRLSDGSQQKLAENELLAYLHSAPGH